MEKPQFVNFIATILKESGFKVYKDFKTSRQVIDIYAVLPTIMGDFTMVVACKNYDKQWEVGIDIIKEMEMIGRSVKASKVVIATSSNFSPPARSYASDKKIKLLDRDSLIILAKKFSRKHGQIYDDENSYNHDTNQELENSYNELNSDQSSSNYYKSDDSKQDSKLATYNEDTYEYDFKATSNGGHYSKQYKSKAKHLDSSNRISPGVKKNLRIRPLIGKNTENFNPRSNSTSLNKRKIEEPKEPLSSKIKVIFNNTIVLIVLVVAITYLLSLIINNVNNIPTGLQGVVKIFSSLILSYGLVFLLNHKGTAVLLKGSIVFFVSLVISILMIILQ